jgi:hypothetical protein
MIKELFIVAFSAIISITLISCSPSGPDEGELPILSVEDISCTEAWIRLAASGISSQSKIEIKANGKLVKQVNIAGTSIDSIVYIDSLLPGREYMFSASIVSQPFLLPGKTEVSARTLDTTSHDFTWETFQFGDYGSSLYDVAIINSNDIWGVGEIYLNGETEAYNAVHWDGEKWELKRIPIKDYGDTYFYTQLRSVYAFSGNNVWFAGYADLIQWNGVNFTSKAFFMLSAPFNGQVNQIWGTGNKNIYCAGNGGAIFHYTGSSWKTIESGTTTSIVDIWGVESAYGETVYCTVSNIFENGDRKILRIKDNKVDSVSWNIGGLLHGIWTNSERYLYVTGWGIYSNRKGFWEEGVKTSVTTNGITGTDINNIFVCGDYGFVGHFNGKTWKIYDAVFNAGYGRIDVKENIVAISGQQNGKGIITTGKRD